MKVSTMRLADKIIGTIVCFTLTVVRNLSDFFGHSQPRTVKSILFIKLAEQGATVLAYPAIRKAVETAGRDNVYFIVFNENRFILDLLDLIPSQNVFAIRTSNIFQTIYSAIINIVRIRQKKIDAAVDFEFFARSSAALAYLSGAKTRVGFHAFSAEASYRGDLMTHRLSFNSHLHAIQIFDMMVDAISQPATNFPAFDKMPAACQLCVPPFVPAESELQTVRNMLTAEFKTADIDRIVLLNANCSDLLPLRRWFSDRYVEFASRLIETYPRIGIVFTGGPGEESGASRLVDLVALPRCVSLAGKTTLRQLMVLYCLADILVTNDSGPAQFASITPIEVVTLFGPETPKVFAAPTPRNHIIWKGIVCSPCVNAYNDRRSACRNNICMQKITVDEVFEQINKICRDRNKNNSSVATGNI